MKADRKISLFDPNQIALQGNGAGRREAASGHFCLANYAQLSEEPKSRSSFCRVSRRDTQCFTNKSGPRVRKSWRTARRQKGLRPLSQACTSGGKIDCGEMGFAASVAFSRAAPFGGFRELSTSSNALLRSSSCIDKRRVVRKELALGRMYAGRGLIIRLHNKAAGS